MEIKEIIDEMRSLLRLEEEAQEKKWMSEGKSLKEMRQEGLVIYPLRLQSKNFGFSDQPLITISFNYDASNFFTSGTPVSLFSTSEEDVCNGQIISIENRKAEILLYTPDFPDWVDERNVGIKRLPDNKSFQFLHQILKRIEKGESKNTVRLFEFIHQLNRPKEYISGPIHLAKEHRLNEAQQNAVKEGLLPHPIQIFHGPPGTGKTTTLVAQCIELNAQRKNIIATAPSNAAVDHLTQCLIKAGLKVIRFGNTSRINEEVWKHTPEGILSQDKLAKEIKRLRIQAEEYRRMAHQYKRHFGKEEREQRKLLFREVYAIQNQIKEIINYHLTHYIEQADVILGTPIGLCDSILHQHSFDVAIIDEAGQCMAPFAWLVMDKAERTILCGDHLQLPPTVISEEADRNGLSTSILEKAINAHLTASFLNIQYRMTPEIAGFSSHYFYNDALISNNPSMADSILFYDTAGADFEEKRDSETLSINNPEELNVIKNHYAEWIKGYSSAVFISPYSSQVTLAKELLSDLKVSTIDSFQGQEADLVILSLVRSNNFGKVGFLSDYRRMNVALTRAKRKLIVIGDSTTLSNDDFYCDFIKYVEGKSGYRSIFELLY